MELKVPRSLRGALSKKDIRDILSKTSALPKVYDEASPLKPGKDVLFPEARPTGTLEALAFLEISFCKRLEELTCSESYETLEELMADFSSHERLVQDALFELARHLTVHSVDVASILLLLTNFWSDLTSQLPRIQQKAFLQAYRRIGELSEECDANKGAVADLEQKLLDQEKRSVTVLMEHAKKSNTELCALRKEVKQLRADNSTLEQSVSDWMDRCAKVEVDFDELKAAKGETTMKLTTKDEEIKAFSDRCLNLVAKNARLREKLKRSQDIMDKYEALKMIVSEDEVHYNKTVDALTERIESLQHGKNILETKLAKIQSQPRTQIKRLQSFCGAVSQVEMDLDEQKEEEKKISEDGMRPIQECDEEAGPEMARSPSCRTLLALVGRGREKEEEAQTFGDILDNETIDVVVVDETTNFADPTPAPAVGKKEEEPPCALEQCRFALRVGWIAKKEDAEIAADEAAAEAKQSKKGKKGKTKKKKKKKRTTTTTSSKPAQGRPRRCDPPKEEIWLSGGRTPSSNTIVGELSWIRSIIWETYWFKHRDNVERDRLLKPRRPFVDVLYDYLLVKVAEHRSMLKEVDPTEGGDSEADVEPIIFSGIADDNGVGKFKMLTIFESRVETDRIGQILLDCVVKYSDDVRVSTFGLFVSEEWGESFLSLFLYAARAMQTVPFGLSYPSLLVDPLTYQEVQKQWCLRSEVGDDNPFLTGTWYQCSTKATVVAVRGAVEGCLISWQRLICHLFEFEPGQVHSEAADDEEGTKKKNLAKTTATKKKKKPSNKKPTLESRKASVKGCATWLADTVQETAIPATPKDLTLALGAAAAMHFQSKAQEASKVDMDRFLESMTLQYSLQRHRFRSRLDQWIIRKRRSAKQRSNPNLSLKEFSSFVRLESPDVEEIELFHLYSLCSARTLGKFEGASFDTFISIIDKIGLFCDDFSTLTGLGGDVQYALNSIELDCLQQCVQWSQETLSALAGRCVKLFSDPEIRLTVRALLYQIEKSSVGEEHSAVAALIRRLLHCLWGALSTTLSINQFIKPSIETLSTDDALQWENSVLYDEFSNGFAILRVLLMARGK